MNDFKSGYVGIIGKPNVGKSTLLNRLLGQKIAITSHKPQTTRTRIQGVLTGDNHQIIFIDTPGIHQPKDQLHQFMMREIDETVADVDLLLILLEPGSISDPDNQLAIQYFRKIIKPFIVVINKSDRYRDVKSMISTPDKILPNTEHIISISALIGTGCDELIKKIVELLPSGPLYYPRDTLTDRTERFLIAELIREKVYEFMHQEIPYSVAVVTDEVKEKSGNKYYVKATIFVEKESQKGMIIGDKGQMLKKIGQESRKEIEILLEKQVYLDLWVKVKKNWRKKPGALKELGLESLE